MRIVGVSGIWSDQNPVWNTLYPAFLNEFPGTTFNVEEEAWLHPWQIHRMNKFITSMRERYDDGDELLLVGHSMGGVIACAFASQLQHSKLVGVVSVFAPHRFPLQVFPLLLKKGRASPTPIITFKALRDELVWWGTKHTNTLAHTILDCDHFREMSLNQKLANAVAQKTREMFFW